MQGRNDVQKIIENLSERTIKELNMLTAKNTTNLYIYIYIYIYIYTAKNICYCRSLQPKYIRISDLVLGVFI